MARRTRSTDLPSPLKSLFGPGRQLAVKLVDAQQGGLEVVARAQDIVANTVVVGWAGKIGHRQADLTRRTAKAWGDGVRGVLA